MVEDFAYNRVTARWERQSSVPLQFAVLVMGAHFNHSDGKYSSLSAWQVPLHSNVALSNFVFHLPHSDSGILFPWFISTTNFLDPKSIEV